jgi:hypothetical protein
MATRVLGMRTVLCLLGVALLVGAAQAKTITFTVEDQATTVKGCVPFTDGDILVPARSCAELLDATVEWDDTTEALVFASAPTQLTFFNDKNRVLLNGEEMFLTHKPQMSHGALLLPIGFLCETLGAKMSRTEPDAATLTLGQWTKMTAPEERKPLEIEVAGVAYNPETYRALPTCDQLRVAASEVAEMFGAEVTWDRELRAAIFKIDDHSVIFFEDKDKGLLDGVPVELTRKPVMSKVQLLVPLDALCEILKRPLDQVGFDKFVVGEPTE